MKVLVTGAAGFIGSHLAEKLLQQGHYVTGLDNFDPFYDPRIKEQNIKNAVASENFHIIRADIRDTSAVNNSLDKSFDCIVHLAAKAGVRPSIRNPAEYADVNINGTVILLQAAQKYNIKKFIFGSSSSVYGNNKKVPFSEDDSVDHPISPYAATKKADELICHTYHHLYGIDVTCLRYFTVYGPRQRPDLAIHKFAKLILQDQPIPVYGDGSFKRDFTYIDDIIQGTLAAIEKCSGYKIYNLGESNTISVNQLIEILENYLGKKAKRENLPSQPGDVVQTCADVNKAKTELGYKPTTNINKGIEKFVDWLKNPS